MQLFALYVDNTAITCDGMLGYLPKSSLKKLGLEGCRIGDEDVPTLMAAAPEVSGLNIGNTQITDRGFVQLAKLPNLDNIRVSSCRYITKAGVKRFSKLKPDCKVAVHFL